MKHSIVIERVKSVKQLEQATEIYPAAYNTEPWNDNWTNETALALLTCYYKTPGFVGWIAKHNNQIIGCAIGNIEPYYTGNIFILKEVFVVTSLQGAKVGSSLLTAMKQDLEKLSIKMILLSTRTSILNFYSKLGFKKMEDVETMIYSY